jgi:hypothetical protein
MSIRPDQHGTGRGDRAECRTRLLPHGMTANIEYLHVRGPRTSFCHESWLRKISEETSFRRIVMQTFYYNPLEEFEEIRAEWDSKLYFDMRT